MPSVEIWMIFEIVSVKTKAVLLAICLLALVTFGQEPVAAFAKQSLGFDLASISFRTTKQTSPGFSITEPPMSPSPMTGDTNISWMTNAVSAKYRQNFPNRLLKFGFRDDRLEVIQISIDSFAVGQTPAVVVVQRKELVRIHDELIKSPANHHPGIYDSSYQLRTGAMCAPSPESLFLMEFQFTPLEKKKSP